MHPKLEIENFDNINFSFQKYINKFLSIVPETDLIGISKIKIINKLQVTNKKAKKTYASYIPSANNKNCVIEIYINTLIKKKIPKYLFNNYAEIAALLLSEYIFHEIGHHVHLFKKHGIKKERFEKFSAQYAKAGYFNYLKSRKLSIMISYRIASLNIFSFNKIERKMFAESRKELIEWIKNNKADISFP